MNRHRTTLACLLFGLLTPILAHAQSNLILPKSHDDFRKLAKPASGGPCELCGTVTNVRSEIRESKKRSLAPDLGGPDVVGTPIVGTRDSVDDARTPSTTTVYIVTVRYDDGKFAFFEDDDEPTLKKGDKVQVIDGRVDLR